jgi:hypothetical protein
MGAAVPGRIPWQAVRDWCEFWDYSGSQCVLLDAVLNHLDAVFIQHHTDKATDAARC